MITIAELRARNNKMSQQELADEIGVGVQSIRRWEKDIYSAKSEYIVRLSKYFNVSSDSLLGVSNKNFSA